MHYMSLINSCRRLNVRSHPPPMFLVRFLAASVGSLLMLPVFADDPGRFEIANADFRVENGIWVADARADLELSTEAQQALENGVTLTIQYQYTVTRSRDYWPDKLVVEHTQDFQLQYLSLSRRYVIRNVNSGEQDSYATLFSALRQIGRVREFPIIVQSLIDPDELYYFSMRVVLSREKLPGRLQVLLFWQDNLSIESDWLRWTSK